MRLDCGAGDTFIPLIIECNDIFSNRLILMKVAMPNIRCVNLDSTFKDLLQIVIVAK
jgi:hypothetical protein